MSKNLNVNLSFTANTAQAKAQIKSLQDSLNSLSMNHVGDINIDNKLRKASAEAAQLKAHLSAATNMKTGALDFTKLSRSLKDSGVSLQHYGETLRAMGPEGQKAFSQLARAVAQSEVPIRRTNKLVKEMSTTLKNSFRWQLSSSILHGFMTTMSDAYNYAKNLNSALTDIRIVSGQSAEQMARFAKQANIAAKDLSTTTQEYAKAALIYYQQGLKQQEVTERTEVTIKMANVTGDAAQDVSSYMTAIWNNFNKAGDESVEHFADIMTKLGAATAASTSEIAAGLSKFSAVADTIGLSFEMATSAVTAIVDQTRETPEVVGTALKTIFSRIEGLQQGETMEDGVNLNKYSKGLQKVGVDIMDTNGKLKDADQILKEIGNKWETLDKNQQVALAQTTAGVRQYNQFMALFDNWDKVEQNLTLAATAEGTLDQQAEIYAESWEAASNRVRASLEGLFDSLLEDDFFIGLLNGFSELIGFIEGTVDALGGMKGVLLAIGAILTKVFSQQMAGGLQNMVHNLQMLTPKGRQAVIDEKRNQLNALANAKDSGNSGYGDLEGAARSRSIRDSVFMQDRFIGAQDKMTDIERDITKTMLDNQAARAEKTAEAAREADKAKKVQDDARTRVTEDIASKSLKPDGSFSKAYFDSESKRFNRAMQDINADSKASANISQVFDEINKKGEVTTKNVRKLGKAVAQIDPKGAGELAKLIPKVGDSASTAEGKMEALTKRVNELREKKAGKNLKGFVEGESGVRSFVRDADDRENKRRQYTTEHVKEKKGAEDINKHMDKIEGPKPSVATGFVSIANAAASAMMVVTMLSGAISTLKNPDASGWDKFLAIIGALGVAIPILTSSFTMLANAESVAGVKALAEAVATKASAAAKKDLSVKTLASAASQKIQAIATKTSAAAMTEDAAATAANTGATAANTGATSANALAQYKQSLGLAAKSIGKLVAAHPVIAAGVVAVAAAVWIGVKAWNADAEAAQKAAKAAAEAQKAYEDAASAHDETMSSIDSYKSASESIKNLTRGTAEWTQEVNKCNQEVISLLKKFPELSQYVENVNGKMEISAEGLNYIQEQSQNELNAAYNSALLANVRAQEAKFESDKTDFKRNTTNSWSDDKTTLTILDGATIDKTLAKTQEIGTGFLYDPEQIQQVLGISENLAKAIYENNEGLIELSNQMTINSATNELVAEQIGMNALGDNADFKEADEQFQSLMAKTYGEEFQKKSDEIYGQYSVKRDKDVQKEYAELIGAEDSKNKADGTGEYLIDGEWQVYSDEIARRALAEAAATASLEGFESQVIEATNALGGFAEALLNDENTELTDKEAADLAEYAKTKDPSVFADYNEAEIAHLREQMGYLDLEALGLDWTGMEVGQDEFIGSVTGALDTTEQHLDERRESDKTNFAENVAIGADAAATGSTYSDYEDTTVQGAVVTGRGAVHQNVVAANPELWGDAGDITIEGKEAEVSDDIVNAFTKAYEDATTDGLNIDSLTDLQEKEMGKEYQNYLESDEGQKASTEEKQAYADKLVNDQIKENDIDAEITSEELDIAEVERYGEHLQNIAKEYDEIDDSVADDPLKAKEIAANVKTTEKGITGLTEAFEEYGDVLKAGDKTATNWTKALDSLQEPMKDVLNLPDDVTLSDAFLGDPENIKDMQKYLEGDIDAFYRLQDAAAQDLIVNMGLEPGATEQVSSLVSEFINSAEFQDLEVGATLDDTGMTAAFQQLLNDGAITAEQLSTILNSINMEPDIQQVPVTLESYDAGTDTATVTGTIHTLDDEGNPIDEPFTNTVSMENLTNKNGQYYLPVINGKGTTKVNAPNLGHKGGGSGGGSGGGGGGGKGSRIKKSPKSSNQKRYERVTNRLQDLSRAQKNAADAADRLWGDDRLKKMDEVSAKIKEQVKLLEEEKLAQIQLYKEQDKQALIDEVNFLKSIYGEAIPNLVVDENGNIDNIEAYFEFLANKIKEIDDKYGNEDIISEADQEAKTLLEERKARLEAVYEPYKETVQLEEDTLDEIEAFERELQDIAFEKITYKLEFEIELNDAELEKIDYFFNKTQKDNIYDMAEGLMIYGKRWEQLSDSAEHYINTYNELQKSFENGEISQDQLMEGQKEAISSLIENAEQMQEFLEYATHEYYKETLEMGIEEIDKYAEGFDRLSDAVDHYMNIASTLGKETDYEYMEKFLNTNIDNINNKLAASTDKYNMLLEQRNYWEAELGKYEYGSTEYEQVKKNLEATNEAVEEAYDERLSIVEEKAEAIRALIENKMAQAAKSFENALTDGSGFDSYMSQFEKLNSRQEEYLTKTNQIYETNKLMRQAAQAADKTDNEVAKRKFKNFENETKKLQENAKLSNYELEIQQAKYDLLLAEIALEEAQNAKSTVRLQRDNEGNFGYVYTANQDEIADAQQQYEDAQNALYNISLQGQQDYTAKYLESLQMMQEELVELDQRWLEGEIATQEEYNRQREAITDHYFNPEYGVLSTYSKLYNVAVQTDTRATEDYWGKSYGNMTTRTEEWKTAVNNYVAEVKDAFGLWASAQTELNNDLNGTLEDNVKFTEDVKNKSKDLANTITTTVIPAVEAEIKKVEELTQKWIDYIKTMEEAIKKSEKIIDPEDIYNGKEKTWDSYGKDFDFMREAIRIGLGKGTTDMTSVDEALAYREQKLLDNVNNKELLDLAGLGQYLGDEEGLRAAVGIQHDNVRNSIARAGYDRSTSSYLNSIADDSSKGYSYKDIYEKYTDLSVDMLLLASGDEKYKEYASYETYEEAADQRRAKVKQLGLGDWDWKKLEILFERANHEPKLAAYLETLRQKVINGIYPDIRPESEAGIPWDLSAAINQYIQSGGKSDNLGYIKSSADLQMALDSRKNAISAKRIKDLGIASNEDTFNESELKRYGAHFDTGGYTGSWGPEGKLAMLHQKELILNASDTENMLKMIEIVRDLSQQIDMFAASQALRGALFSSPSYLTGQNGTLEQNVHIEASFPGVTDRNQIEEAFGDLINVAYQYAHRK